MKSMKIQKMTEWFFHLKHIPCGNSIRPSNEFIRRKFNCVVENNQVQNIDDFDNIPLFRNEFGSIAIEIYQQQNVYKLCFITI